MLSDTKKDCIFFASQIKDYQTADLNVLADAYCAALDTNDATAQNSYLSALLLRFWFTIDKMHKKSQNIGLDREDFFMWLVEAINYACKYRAWQDPQKKTNAQSCINKCIHTIRLQHYYEYNLDKSRANFSTISLQTPAASDDKAQTVSCHTLEDTIEDTYHSDYVARGEATDVARSYIQGFIHGNKLIEAIILDTIAFMPTERITKKTVKTDNIEQGQKKSTEYFSEFWAHRLIQYLSNLDQSYDTYFTETYDVNARALEAALTKIRTANNQKLYRYLRKCLTECKASLTTSVLY